MSVRVRFAPSPTGFLHVGNARTALFNWLYARRHRGVFVLRIEDTDRERSRREFEDAILRDLRWLGLEWEEGPDIGGGVAPYRQSEAGPLYLEAAERLLRRGRAYRCFCSAVELEEERRRQEQAGQPPRYSGRCRDLPPVYADRLHEAGNPSVVRFKLPREEIVVTDLVKGEVRFHGRDLDDFILLRADGSASYHLAVVVDDHRMRVTHVIRGEDHLSNTPRQIALAGALGSAQPRFAHLPLILGSDGALLSKRHGDFSVRALAKMGFVPEALVNYLGLLGWSPPDGVSDVMTIREMAEHFTLERVGRSPAKFDQERLLWFDRQHLRRLSAERLLAELGPAVADDDLTRCAVEALRGEVRSVAELRSALDAIRTEPEVGTLNLTKTDQRVLTQLRTALLVIPEDVEDHVDKLLAHAARDLNREERRALMRAARLALIGKPDGLPVATLLRILGAERAKRRVENALKGCVAA